MQILSILISALTAAFVVASTFVSPISKAALAKN